MCALSRARCGHHTRAAVRPPDTSEVLVARIHRPRAGSSRWEGQMDETTTSVVRAAIEAAVPAYDDLPTPSDDDLERARRAADALRAGAEVATVDPRDLAALAPDEAGRLAEDLAAGGRTDALTMVVTSTPPHRYPLVTLLRAAAALPPELWARDMLVRAVALAPPKRLGSALDEVGADPTLAGVVAQV